MKFFHVRRLLAVTLAVRYPAYVSRFRQEKLVIEAIKKQLQAQISDSFEQLCRLQEARQQVLADLQDKNIALDIDVEQYNLTEDSSEISYKPDPCRIPKGYTEITKP